jgi:hypothetical protein
MGSVTRNQVQIIALTGSSNEDDDRLFIHDFITKLENLSSNFYKKNTNTRDIRLASGGDS